MTRQVTEEDLRAPEFREGTPDDYERRNDGRIVRKDRFKRGMASISTILFGARHEYEIPEVIDAVRRLAGLQLLAALENAKDVYEGEPKVLEALDYVKAVIDSTPSTLTK